jgi:hypothetical protein
MLELFFGEYAAQTLPKILQGLLVLLLFHCTFYRRVWIHHHPTITSIAMSLGSRGAIRCCARAARTSHALQCRSSILSRHTTSRRWQSTEAAAAPNPKIDPIVESIGKLTLLETADLIKSLKVRI